MTVLNDIKNYGCGGAVLGGVATMGFTGALAGGISAVVARALYIPLKAAGNLICGVGHPETVKAKRVEFAAAILSAVIALILTYYFLNFIGTDIPFIPTPSALTTLIAGAPMLGYIILKNLYNLRIAKTRQQESQALLANQTKKTA